MTTAATIIGAGIIGTAVGIGCVWLFPSQSPADRIMHAAQEHFSGVVQSVALDGVSIRLALSTGGGARAVTLAEVGVVPSVNGRFDAWRGRCRDYLCSILVGQRVDVYTVRTPGGQGGPVAGHLVLVGSQWLNGRLMEQGFGYTLRLPRDQRVATDDLRQLEWEAREHTQGCWAFVDREQYRAFPLHF